MPFSLLPKLMARSLTDLCPELLRSRDIRLLMLDFDNTIVPYTTNVPTPQMADWLEMMKKTDITLCIVSNSHSDRVPKFCEERGLHCITHAAKPFPKGIKACLKQYGIPAQNAAMVGDQIFTDVLGGNCAGAQSILVDAIHNHNFLLKARHVLEIPFIFLARKRRI